MVYPSSIRFPSGLYGITPEWATQWPRLLAAIEAAAAGGMVALQWRQKLLANEQQLEKASEIAALCKRLGVVFIVNDDIDLAIASQADGVHVGRDDASVQLARQKLGPKKIIGASCYNQLDRAQAAIAAGADYIAFGSVFSSSIKPEAVRAPLSLFAQSQKWLTPLKPRPALVAIGGITKQNAASVVAAGADSLAVISDLFNASDITQQAQSYSRLFQSSL